MTDEEIRRLKRIAANDSSPITPSGIMAEIAHIALGEHARAKAAEWKRDEASQDRDHWKARAEAALHVLLGLSLRVPLPLGAEEAMPEERPGDALSDGGPGAFAPAQPTPPDLREVVAGALAVAGERLRDGDLQRAGAAIDEAARVLRGEEGSCS